MCVYARLQVNYCKYILCNGVRTQWNDMQCEKNGIHRVGHRTQYIYNMYII